MNIQSSTIPSSFPGTKYISSNHCLNISTLLRFYLESLGVESQVISGVYYIPDNSFAHVFLKIGGHVIDNTYIHTDGEKSTQGNLDTFIEELSPELRNLPNYMEEAPSNTRMPLWEVRLREKSL